MFKAVGHKEIHFRSHRRQTAHTDGTRRRTVYIVVGDNQDFFLTLNRIRQTAGGGFAVCQRLIRQKRSKFVVQLGRTLHITRSTQPRNQRIGTGSKQVVKNSRINGTCLDFDGHGVWD